MDIRKTQGESPEKTQRSESGFEDFLIKIDSATENRLLNESVIYNLVQKTRSIQEMKALYNKNRPVYDSPYLNYIAAYVHTGIAPLFFISVYFYLIYKRKNTLFTLTSCFCVATGMNELGKYIYVRFEDPQKTEQYDEFSRNYKALMRSYQRAITPKLMLYGILGIKEEDFENWEIKRLLGQKVRGKFAEELILSKYI